MNSKNRPTHRPTVRQVMIKLLKDKDKERILTRDQNRDSVPQAGSRCRKRGTQPLGCTSQAFSLLDLEVEGMRNAGSLTLLLRDCKP